MSRRAKRTLHYANSAAHGFRVGICIDDLFAYAKEGCVDLLKRLLVAETKACAPHLAAALVIAEVEYRCCADAFENDYIGVMEALLAAGAPASALLPDMTSRLSSLKPRASDRSRETDAKLAH